MHFHTRHRFLRDGATILKGTGERVALFGDSSAPKLPQPGKVGHPGRRNKAVPAGWIRRIVDARFEMQ
jgi:hypothetical protein